MLIKYTLLFLSLLACPLLGVGLQNRKAQSLLMNEDDLRAKFESLYGKDSDVPHSIGFLKNEGQVGYRDEKVS